MKALYTKKMHLTLDGMGIPYNAFMSARDLPHSFLVGDHKRLVELLETAVVEIEKKVTYDMDEKHYVYYTMQYFEDDGDILVHVRFYLGIDITPKEYKLLRLKGPDTSPLTNKINEAMAIFNFTIMPDPEYHKEAFIHTNWIENSNLVLV